MLRTILLWATKEIIGGLRHSPEEIEVELKNHILKLKKDNSELRLWSLGP
jgi:hypothetical protein